MTNETRVTMPMPPIHAEAMRQNCNPLGKLSMSLRMDAPVVVKPETLSKKALMTVNSPPNIKKGMAPKTQAAIQQPVTMQQPSSMLMFSCGWVLMMAKKPHIVAAIAEKTKGSKLSSLSFLKAMKAAKYIRSETPIREKPA